MEFLQKIGYVKGLAEGLQLDADKPENKVLLAVVDLLDDLAVEAGAWTQAGESAERDLTALSAEVAEMQEQIEDVEGDVEGICEALDVVIERMGPEVMAAIMEKAKDETLYEVRCPSCGEEIVLDEDMIEAGGIHCPQCKEHLEFDVECDCGHDHCEH